MDELCNRSSTLTGSGVMPEEDFSFDASGNRDSGDYAVSSDNRMSQSPADAGNHYEYTYEEQGNRIVRYLKNVSGNTLETTTYVHDYRNRLQSLNTYTVSGTSSTLTHSERYEYNAFDQRVTRGMTGGIYEQFIYDGVNLALVLDLSLAVTHRYLMGDAQNQVFAEDASDGYGGYVTRFALADHQGIITRIINRKQEKHGNRELETNGARTQTEILGLGNIHHP